MKKKSTSSNVNISMPLLSITVIKFIIMIMILLIVLIVLINYKMEPTFDDIMSLSEISFTFALSLVGIAFAVSSLKPAPTEKKETEIYHTNLNNYVFSILLLATTSIFTYVVGLFKIETGLNYIFIALPVVLMLFSITRTLVFLTANYNIDGKNSKK